VIRRELDVGLNDFVFAFLDTVHVQSIGCPDRSRSLNERLPGVNVRLKDSEGVNLSRRILCRKALGVLYNV
jgi:hypothetical protein